MVKQAFIRASIPFSMPASLITDEKFISDTKEKGWTKSAVQGDFLLKHINTSFSNNVVCFTKPCSQPLVVEYKNPNTTCRYDISVSEVSVYCFDTGIGICTLHIPYDSAVDADDLANVCSTLYVSVDHGEHKGGIPIEREGKPIYMSNVADEFLTDLLGDDYSLYSMFNEVSLRRINMFTAALCDKPETEGDKTPYTQLCYLLSNAYDTRDKSPSYIGQNILEQQPYIRWGFSKRGCAAVSNLTGQAANDSHLQNRWFESVKSNYFYLYLMVFHEKIAIYNYLNNAAEDPHMNMISLNQEALLNFNSKYVFTIVSDEPFIQSVYTKFKQVTDADDLYAELLDQLKHMFEYAQFRANQDTENANRRLNLTSVVISAICLVSILFESINFFTSQGFKFGFNSMASIIFTSIIAFEAVALVFILVWVSRLNKTKKKKK